MSEKCCNRVGVQSTHWEGCHEVHPSCAAFKAGREAGMREAAGILGRRIGECDNMVASAPLTQRGINLYEDAARELIAMEAVILAAIGEGK